jgi:hypothetical protein
VRILTLLVLIAAGLGYSHERELAHNADVQSEFNLINARYFDGRLDADVRWGDLDQLGVTRFYDNGVEQAGQDYHGPLIQGCMRRFDHSGRAEKAGCCFVWSDGASRDDRIESI